MLNMCVCFSFYVIFEELEILNGSVEKCLNTIIVYNILTSFIYKKYQILTPTVKVM